VSVLTWQGTPSQLQFALMLWSIYPFKHYLTPFSKLHSCLAVVTSYNGDSSANNITPNNLGAFWKSSALMCVLVLICFVFKLYCQYKGTTSQLAPPRPPSVNGAELLDRFYIFEKFSFAHFPIFYVSFCQNLKMKFSQPDIGTFHRMVNFLIKFFIYSTKFKHTDV
jgi:hypothetical protein